MNAVKSLQTNVNIAHLSSENSVRAHIAKTHSVMVTMPKSLAWPLYFSEYQGPRGVGRAVTT